MNIDRINNSIVMIIFAFCLPSAIAASMLILGFDIPLFISVRSAGTFWPALHLDPLLKNVVASAVVAFVLFWWGDPKASTSVRVPCSRAEVAAVGILTALLVYKYSYPPYLIGSNFRMLWIDPLVEGGIHRSPIIAKIYFLPTLLRSAYTQIFGPENTHIFVVLSVVAGALLFLDCCRLAGMGRWTRLFATLSFVGSAHMLIFYQVNEDFTLITPLGLACVNAFLRRNAVATGLTFAVLLLSRPTFAFLPAAIMFADVVTQFLRHQGGFGQRFWNATFRNRYAWVASILALAIVGSIHLYWYANGEHILQINNLKYSPQEIEGFRISSWSWVYTAHYLWVVPPLVTGAAFAGLLIPNSDRRLALLAASLVTTYFLLLDRRAGDMYYYNIRYLLYVYPFVLLAAWSFVAPMRGIARGVAGAGIVLISMFGAHVSIADVVKYPRSSKSHEVYHDRAILRRTVGDRTVMLDRETCGMSGYNIVASLLIRGVSFVKLPDLERRQPGILVICEDPAEPPAGYTTVLRTGGLTFAERD